MANVLPDPAQQDIFGTNRDVKVAGMLNPTADVRKVQAGYQVSGQWPWASGTWHAEWALVGIVVPDEAGKPVDQALAFVPMSDTEEALYRSSFIPVLTLILAGPQLGFGRPPCLSSRRRH